VHAQANTNKLPLHEHDGLSKTETKYKLETPNIKQKCVLLLPNKTKGRNQKNFIK